MLHLNHFRCQFLNTGHSEMIVKNFSLTENETSTIRGLISEWLRNNEPCGAYMEDGRRCASPGKVTGLAQ